MNREENFKKKFSSIINEHKSVLDNLEKNYFNNIFKAAKTISRAIENNSTIFFCGNGGSASDSEHLAAELVGRFKKDRPSLRAISLVSNISIITCISNDYCFEDVFSRQLSGLAKKNDVLVAISTSGNSENVIRCLEMAKKIGLCSISFLGKGGGKLKEISDQKIIIKSNETARIQEMHILLGHILVEMIEMELGYA